MEINELCSQRNCHIFNSLDDLKILLKTFFTQDTSCTAPSPSLKQQEVWDAACPPQRAGCQRLQAALSRMREDIHHAACLQPHVRDNSWEKWKHRIYASACKIPRAEGSFLKVHWGSHGLGRVPGFAGAQGAWGQEPGNQLHSQWLWRKQLERESHSTMQSVFWHQHSCPLLCHVQTCSCLRVEIWASWTEAGSLESRTLNVTFPVQGACKSSQAYSIHHPRQIRQ